MNPDESVRRMLDGTAARSDRFQEAADAPTLRPRGRKSAVETEAGTGRMFGLAPKVKARSESRSPQNQSTSHKRFSKRYATMLLAHSKLKGKL